MDIKDKAAEVLMELGADVRLTGFDYIVTAMELFHNGWKKSKLTSVYVEIAKIHRVSAACVERCIRYVFQKLMTEQSLSLVERYLDTCNQTNGANLSKLYYRISKELEV